MTHLEKHGVSEQEIAEFFNDVVIFTRMRKDNSFESMGKLSSGRYLTVVYRKFSKYDYFIITAFDISENYKKDFIEKELRKI